VCVCLLWWVGVLLGNLFLPLRVIFCRTRLARRLLRLSCVPPSLLSSFLSAFLFLCLFLLFQTCSIQPSLFCFPVEFAVGAVVRIFHFLFDPSLSLLFSLSFFSPRFVFVCVCFHCYLARCFVGCVPVTDSLSSSVISPDSSRTSLIPSSPCFPYLFHSKQR
jgi:hypothetical protein